MASIKANVVKATFCFSLAMNERVQFNSSVLIVGDVPWRILFSRTTIKSENVNYDVIDVFLACEYEHKINENTEWWIEAEAELKLLTSKENMTPIGQRFSKTTFKDGSRILKLADFVKYNDFVDPENGYFQSGIFAFECTITSSPLFIEAFPAVSYGVKCTSKEFIMAIEKVNKLKEIISATYNVRGINWNVKFRKTGENLSICLCRVGGDLNFALEEKISFKVKLVSSMEDVDHIVGQFTAPVKSNYGWPEFIEWNTLIDIEKYGYNNRSVFVISIDVGPLEPLYKAEHSFWPKASVLNCPICFSKFENLDVFAAICGHLFCGDCIKALPQQSLKCPICNKHLSMDDLRKIYLN